MGVLRGAFTDHVSFAILRRGFWEQRSIEQINEWAGVTLPSHGRLLDVGANIGFFSLKFAHIGWDVVSIEAMTRNRQAIQVSLCLNTRFQRRVHVVPTALVATPEVAATSTCLVKTGPQNFGDGKVQCTRGSHECPPPKASHQCERVRPATLDQVLMSAGGAASRVHLAKIDVEGSECQVLEGGQSLFVAPWRVSVLQIEVNTDRTRRCVTEMARRYEYRIAQPRQRRFHANGAVADVNWWLVDNRTGAPHV
jgi:FkbM family methyltransferase